MRSRELPHSICACLEVRGGFGTFYERMQDNDVYNIAPAAPFSNTPGVSNTGFTDPFASWQTGTSLSTTSLPTVPQGMTTLATRYPAPGVAQYSLGVQREVMPALIFVAQYVGNGGWSQNVILPINPLPVTTPLATRQIAGAGKLTSAENSLYRTFPGFTEINEQANIRPHRVQQPAGGIAAAE